MHQVNLYQRQYREIVEDTWTGVLVSNAPPTMFLRGEMPVRIVTSSQGPKIDLINPDKMFGIAINACDFTTNGPKGCYPTKPTQELAKTMCVLPDNRLPVLDGISPTPLFAPSGELKTTDGYSEELRTYFYGMENLKLGTGPTNVADAVATIRGVFSDFPLAKESEFTHLLAAILCPFVRKLIQGTTPIHLIEANSPGGGKTLMAEVINLIATGEKLAPISPSDKEEEMRKRITSLLVEGKGIVVLDNLSRELNSGVLASAITGERWSDRPLGLTKIVELPNQVTWIVTGNNPRLSLEVARRCIRVRLTAEGDKPWNRQSAAYRHPDIRGWVIANRGNLIQAIKVLVDNWFAHGRPKPPSGWNLGSFESWSHVVGGIIHAAGVEGFLQSNDEMYSATDTDTAEWEAFVHHWWETWADKWLTPGEIAVLADAGDHVPSALGDGLERSRRIKMGVQLTKRRDTWIGGWKLEQRKDEKAKTVLYRLRGKDQGVQKGIQFVDEGKTEVL